MRATCSHLPIKKEQLLFDSALKQTNYLSSLSLTFLEKPRLVLLKNIFKYHDKQNSKASSQSLLVNPQKKDNYEIAGKINSKT
jgi:hypothetical protein